MMKIFWISFMVVLAFSFCSCKHGACDNYEYNRAIRTCQAQFFGKLANSTKPDPFDDCQLFYNEAVECLNKSVLQHCYEGQNDREIQKKILEQETTFFGDKEYYCKFGGIPTIYYIIQMLENNDSFCQPVVNTSMVVACENSFHESFRNNPGDPELCEMSEKTEECQTLLLSHCELDFSIVFASTAKPIVNTAAGINVLCPKVQEILINTPENNSGSTHHTAWDVLTPIIIIGILILLALAVGFCHFAKKEARKAAEEKKLNKQKISQKLEEQGFKERSQEPYHEGQELMPQTVVQETNEVSSI